jgi:hypothetical protein
MLEEVGTMLQNQHQDLLHEFYYFTKKDWWYVVIVSFPSW